MISSNDVRRDLSIPMAKANLYMLLITLPLIASLTLVFMAAWGIESFFSGFNRFLELNSILPSLLIGVPVHELLHGLCWVYFGKKSLRDIKFGFQWKIITPYAHIKVPIQAGAYRMGTVMPALMLGLLPYVIGLATGNGWFAAFGFVFVFAAGGDLLILWLLRMESPQALVVDHPSQAGCYVYEADI